MKTYAYVKSETCSTRRTTAALPGECIGLVPVSQHGDYIPWLYGKCETSQIAAGTHPIVVNSGAGRDVYLMHSASAVQSIKGWA